MIKIHRIDKGTYQSSDKRFLICKITSPVPRSKMTWVLMDNGKMSGDFGLKQDAIREIGFRMEQGGKK